MDFGLVMNLSRGFWFWGERDEKNEFMILGKVYVYVFCVFVDIYLGLYCIILDHISMRLKVKVKWSRDVYMAGFQCEKEKKNRF